MIVFKSKHINMKVTPLHEMWIKQACQNDLWRKVKAIELYNKKLAGANSEFYVLDTAPNSYCEFDAETITLPMIPYSGGRKNDPYYKKDLVFNSIDFAEFIGWVITDGFITTIPHKYFISISQSSNKPQHVIALRDLLNRLNIKFTERLDKRQHYVFCIHDKRIHSWIAKNVGIRTEDKRIPRFLLLANQEIMLGLYRGLMLGDGSYNKKSEHKSRVFYCMTKNLADDMHELSIRLGFSVKCKKYKNSGYGDKPMYRVMISDPKRHRHIKYFNISKERYEGIIYCYNVPNHLFVTRRNGIIAIHGNTSNRNTSEVMNRNRQEKCKDFQIQIAAILNRSVVTELLREGGYPLWDKTGMPTAIWKFREIDIDLQIKKQNQEVYMYEHYAITEDEMRNGLGLDPIDTNDERNSMYLQVVKIPLLEAEAKAKATFAPPPTTSPSTRKTQSRKHPTRRKDAYDQLKAAILDQVSYKLIREMYDGIWTITKDDLKDYIEDYYINHDNDLAQHKKDAFNIIFSISAEGLASKCSSFINAAIIMGASKISSSISKQDLRDGCLQFRQHIFLLNKSFFDKMNDVSYNVLRGSSKDTAISTVMGLFEQFYPDYERLAQKIALDAYNFGVFLGLKAEKVENTTILKMISDEPEVKEMDITGDFPGFIKELRDTEFILHGVNYDEE